MKRCVIALSAAVLSVSPLSAEEGVEQEKSAQASAPYRHWRITAWELRDRTDNVGELVHKREWLLLPGTEKFEFAGNLADMQDVVAGEGKVYLRLAPLPGSRSWEGNDFVVNPDSTPVLATIPRACRTLEIPYSGGDLGRRAALTCAQRRLRARVSGRDGLFLSNTWGDRNRDSRLNEKFMREEIAAAAKVGIEVVQIDDGWQRGRTANSSAANGKGVWNGYWASDPDFWLPDPVRFPRGLGPLAEYAAARGLRLGLWFGPDSSEDAANWRRDADLLVKMHRELGIDYFKIDSLKTNNELSLNRQRNFFATVLAESDGRVVFDLDVTAERRPGYFALPEIGPVFVENRYTDWHKYWPHQTLRQFWALCEVIDPVRLRMEILNPLRNREYYKGDPLAPANWPVESIFASVMLSSPLGWFEASGLSPETAERLSKIVATWKLHRERLHGGVVHPIGTKPDGVAWTGFAVANPGTVDLILFRELNDQASFKFDLSAFGQFSRVQVFSPRGRARLEGNVFEAMLNDKLDFVWAQLQ